MSCVTRIPAAADTDTRAPARRFRTGGQTRAQPDVVARQASFALLTFELHDAREDALAFLHTECTVLGGRPIDVAGDTPEGYEAATSRLRALRS